MYRIGGDDKDRDEDKRDYEDKDGIGDVGIDVVKKINCSRGREVEKKR